MKLNFSGKISQFFVKNYAVSILMLLGTIIIGAAMYLLTPVQYNPEVVMPLFRIQVAFPGATQEEVEQFITLELEERLADIPGVDTINARSVDGGVAIVTVEFQIGEDLEVAKTRVQSKITASLDELQPNMERPLIQPIDPDDVPIVTVGFTSRLLTQNQVRDEIIPIMNELRRLPGVANLDIHGGEPRALRIILDEQRLRDRNLSPTEIEQVIANSNLIFTVGTVRDGQQLQQITVDGALNAENIRNLYIKPDIKLQDVATIVDGYAEKESYVLVTHRHEETEPVVFLSVAKRKGDNAVAIADLVLAELADILQRPQYGQIEYHVYRNDGQVATEATNGLGLSLIQSIGIVFLVLLLFVGFRSAMLVALAIPLSLALVFVVGYFAGQTINRITLFALILSLGLLVDSATVVVENITRYAKQSMPLTEAIPKAVNEVGIGLLLSTITSVIVFLPTSQITGMMGAYMGPLSFFVPAALIMSLIVAYTLTPFLASVAFSGSQPQKPRRRSVLIAILMFIPNLLEQITRLFEVLARYYGYVLGWLLHRNWRQYLFLVVTFGLLLFVLSFPVLLWVHFRMLPSADRAQYYLYIDAPEGTDIEVSRRVADLAVQLLFQDEYTQSVQQFIGVAPVVDFNGLFKEADQRTARHLVTLRANITPPAARTELSQNIVSAMRERFNRNPLIKIYQENGFTVQFIEEPPGPPVQATLVAKIKGPDPAIRQAMAEDMMAKMAQVEGVVDIQSSLERPYLRAEFTVDYEKTNSFGISTAQIVNALQIATDGKQIAQYRLPEQNEYSYITLEYPSLARTRLADLGSIYLKSAAGQQVPLSEMVTQQDRRTTTVLLRDEREATTYITAELDQRSVVYAVIDLLFDLVGNGYDLPGGGTQVGWDLFGLYYEDDQQIPYTIAWGGEWEMTLENFRDLGLAMIAAFVLIYATLVFQFRSFLAPALIMTTVPLAFIGIMPGFALLDAQMGTFLTATSLIGFIALMGIVVNNAILYLEYYSQLLLEKVPVTEALLITGKTRLRPILLTSATTVLGSLTIVNDPVWSGLAWAIVFGLSISSLFTLGVFPILLNQFRPKLT